MGTSAWIGFVENDGSITASQCNYDAYDIPPQLNQVDDDEEFAEELANFGYMSAFENGQPYLTPGVQGEPPMYFKNLDEFEQEQGMVDLLLLFDSEWLFWSKKENCWCPIHYWDDDPRKW